MTELEIQQKKSTALLTLSPLKASKTSFSLPSDRVSGFGFRCGEGSKQVVSEVPGTRLVNAASVVVVVNKQAELHSFSPAGESSLLRSVPAAVDV